MRLKPQGSTSDDHRHSVKSNMKVKSGLQPEYGLWAPVTWKVELSCMQAMHRAHGIGLVPQSCKEEVSPLVPSNPPLLNLCHWEGDCVEVDPEADAHTTGVHTLRSPMVVTLRMSHRRCHTIKVDILMLTSVYPWAVSSQAAAPCALVCMTDSGHHLGQTLLV
jgi:hypothetical protein